MAPARSTLSCKRRGLYPAWLAFAEARRKMCMVVIGPAVSVLNHDKAD
jgi:hypothetical protein